MKCHICGEEAVYRCPICGKAACGVHIRFRALCQDCTGRDGGSYNFSIRVAREEDRKDIGGMVSSFWGEDEQVMFGRTIVVTEEPAFVAEVEGEIAGFIAYSELDGESLVISALGVRPEYQGYGIGRALVSAVEEEARRRGKRRVLVVTSNDDLPALAFYQLIGFQIFDVAPGEIEEKHGSPQEGIGSIPVRDEIRLRKEIAAD